MARLRAAARALGRHVEAQRRTRGCALEAVDERARVEVRRRRRDWTQPTSRRAARSGRCARPAPAPPRGCCGGSPRAARGGALRSRLVLRRHAVHVVGADGQRDLRELRAVERPVHLDRRRCCRRPGARARRASRRRSRWSARAGIACAAAARRRGSRRRRPAGRARARRCRSGRRRQARARPAAWRRAPRPGTSSTARKSPSVSMATSATASMPAARSARQTSASERCASRLNDCRSSSGIP